MKRREILKYTALITGAAVSAPLITSILSGCKPGNEAITNFQPVFFSQEDFQVVHDLVDIILPQTDSPSASAIGVDQTIDTIVANVYTESDKDAYRNRFAALVEYLEKQHYRSSDQDEKLTILTKLMESNDHAEARQAFLELKQQTISFYLTTEEIGEKFLNYLPVPGAYEPCIELESVGGKIWSI